MEIIDGIIESYDEHGTMYITARYDNTERFVKRKYGDVRILLQDGRRRKC